MRHLRRIAVLLGLVAALTGIVGLVPGTAEASTTPSAPDVMAACLHSTPKPPVSLGRWPDACTWEPLGSAAYPNTTGTPSDYVALDAGHTVGSPTANCLPNPVTSAIGWSDQTGTTSSVGVEYAFELEVGLAAVVKMKTSFKISYQHGWQASHTETQTTMVPVPAYSIGWVTRQPYLHTVVGRWRVNFDKRVMGHYIWYVNEQITGPGTEPTTGATGLVVAHSRPMNLGDLQTSCPHTVVPRSRLGNVQYDTARTTVSCLTVPPDQPFVLVHTCDTTERDSWLFTQVGVTPSGAGLYKVLNLATGGCLATSYGLTGLGTTVTASPCSDTAATQVWALEPGTAGAYALRNNRTGSCLSAYDGNTMTLGVITTCDPAATAQRWVLR